MGRKVDLDDIIDAGGVAEIIGLAQRNNVYTYRRKYADFPPPIITHGRCYMWLGADIRRWMRSRGKGPLST